MLLPRVGYLSQLAVADARTMTDLTIFFVDLNEFNEQLGRTFRAVPQEVEPITANLAIANMDFFEFADSANPDGVFRGFEAPAPNSSAHGRLWPQDGAHSLDADRAAILAGLSLVTGRTVTDPPGDPHEPQPHQAPQAEATSGTPGEAIVSLIED